MQIMFRKKVLVTGSLAVTSAMLSAILALSLTD